MLESICGWEKLDNRRGFHSDRQRLISAISGRVRNRIEGVNGPLRSLGTTSFVEKLDPQRLQGDGDVAFRESGKHSAPRRNRFRLLRVASPKETPNGCIPR